MSCEITEFIRSRNCTHRSWRPWKICRQLWDCRLETTLPICIQNRWKRCNRFSNFKSCFSCLPCFYNRVCLYWAEEAIWDRLCPLLPAPCIWTQFPLHSGWGQNAEMGWLRWNTNPVLTAGIMTAVSVRKQGGVRLGMSPPAGDERSPAPAVAPFHGHLPGCVCRDRHTVTASAPVLHCPDCTAAQNHFWRSPGPSSCSKHG